ncbi:hypothetical protein COOONC_04168 [Cooperia oncophora]
MDGLEPMDVDHQAQSRAPRLLGDTDIAAIIAAIREDQPGSSASAQTPASNPSFVRKGYASQFEFNDSVMKNLTKINKNGLRREDEDLLQAAIELIKVRNETLKIADKHPGVFSFLDSKKQAEAVKSSDPFLSEFLEQVHKEEKATKKKRPSLPESSSQPFRGRESAWRPDSRFFSYNQSSDLILVWNDRDMEIASRLANLTRNTAKTDRKDQGVFVSCAGTRDIGEMSVQEGSKLVANGAVKEVAHSQRSDIFVHPLSVAEGKKLRLVLDLSYLNKNECDKISQDIRRDLKDFGWFEAKEKSEWRPNRIERAERILWRMLREKAPSLHTRMRWEGSLASMSLVISDKDKRRSRAITTAVAEAQSSVGVRSPQDLTLFNQRLRGQDIPFG